MGHAEDCLLPFSVAPRCAKRESCPIPIFWNAPSFAGVPTAIPNLWGAFWEVYKGGRGPDGKEFGAQGVIDGVTEYEGPIPAELA
jgi:hypothetical protein